MRGFRSTFRSTVFRLPLESWRGRKMVMDMTASTFIKGMNMAVMMAETSSAGSPPRMPDRVTPIMAVLLRKVLCSSTPFLLGSLVTRGTVR